MKPVLSLRIAFRVDAAMHIGTGHVMRCLTLANALREKGADTLFICREHKGHLAKLIRQQGHSLYVLPAPGLTIQEQPSPQQNPPHQGWLGETWQTDAEQTGEVLAKAPIINWLIVDHYALDSRWQTTLRKYCKHIMVIDDLADRPHDCDLLLDQTLGRKAQDYTGRVPEHCTILASAEYALLRPEFSQWRPYSLKRREKPALRQLLVNLGGVDNHNITGATLQALGQADLPQAMHIMVVMGTNAPNLAQVKQQAAAMPVTTVVRAGVDNMAEIMAESDLAIGAAGTTSWERCCLGLPTLMLVLADNQTQIAQNLASAGAAVILKQPCDVTDLLEYAIPRLAVLSNTAASLCDGQGMEKVLKEIQAMQ